MPSIPAQDEFLAATRKGQEAMITTIRTWIETVRTATPKLASAYAPLTDKLPKLSSVSMPFAGQLPQPEEAVASAYRLAEQLLANQRKFAEDLLQAMVPLMPGRAMATGTSQTTPTGTSQTTPQGHGLSEPSASTAATSRPKSTAARPSPKSTATITAPKSTAARPSPKKAAGKSTAKSTAAKSTTARRAPKDTPAS